MHNMKVIHFPGRTVREAIDVAEEIESALEWLNSGNEHGVALAKSQNRSPDYEGIAYS